MTNDELRLAIAKAKGLDKLDETRCPVCGWTYSDTGCHPGDCSMRPVPSVKWVDRYPNWPEDIAAAFALEDEIHAHDRAVYATMVRNIIMPREMYVSNFQLIHAPAWVRCMAYLDYRAWKKAEGLRQAEGERI